MIDTTSVSLPLIDELWAEADHRCPYVRHDDRGCYCASPAILAAGDPYMPCDTASLQLWCLTAEHYVRCCLWPAGDTA